MKSFTSIILASAAVVSAQVVVNGSSYTCLSAGNFCAADSMTTNIIIRCNDGVGTPGNCDDNLAGVPPSGDSYSPCWQSSPDAGDAACTKNCIIYGETEELVPGCSPSSSITTSLPLATESATSSAASSEPVTTETISETTTVPCTTSTSSSTSEESTVTETISTTTTVPCSTSSTETESTVTVTICPSSASSGFPTAPGNGTSTVPPTSVAPSTPVSGTATPSAPTSTGVIPTGAAVAQAGPAGVVLAAAGAVLAYLL